MKSISKTTAVVCLFIISIFTKSTPSYYEKQPILLAVSKKDVDTLRQLISKKIKFTVKDEHDPTPLSEILHSALYTPEEKVKFTILLIDTETPAHLSDLLILAAKEGLASVVQMLLYAGAEAAFVSRNSRSALTEATFWGHSDIVQMLLDRGAQVNVRNENFETPLHLAAFHGRNDIVKMLLDHGAQVNIENNNLETPLHLATRGYGSNKTIEILLSHGAEINSKNKNLETPLYFAVHRANYPEILSFLIKGGADVNQANNEGKTLLLKLFAGSKDFVKCVHILINAGADVHHHDNEGNTLLTNILRSSFAILSKERLELVKYLINAKVDLNIADKHGATALIVAVEQNYDASLIKLLIDAGADVNVQSATAFEGPSFLGFFAGKIWKKGYTALMIACMYFNTDVVKLLIDAGADVNIKNNEGKTAFDILRKIDPAKRPEVIKIRELIWNAGGGRTFLEKIYERLIAIKNRLFRNNDNF